MSTVDIFDEKFAQCQNIECLISDLIRMQEMLNGMVTNMNSKIAIKISEKESADIELETYRSNLPSDIEFYKDQLTKCNRIAAEINALNNQKASTYVQLDECTLDLEAAIEQKTIWDAELVEIQSVL